MVPGSQVADIGSPHDGLASWTLFGCSALGLGGLSSLWMVGCGSLLDSSFSRDLAARALGRSGLKCSSQGLQSFCSGVPLDKSGGHCGRSCSRQLLVGLASLITVSFGSAIGTG